MLPNIRMGGEFSVFDELLESRFPKKKHFRTGETVYGSGDWGGQYCYYLQEGLVNTVFLHEQGGSIELNVRGAGTIFPLYYTFETTPMEKTFEAVAEADVTALFIPKAELRALMLEVPALAIAMVDAYAKFATYLDYCLASRLYDSLPVRVCNYLVMHADDHGVVSGTQEQIARAIGASRAKVTEAIADLVGDGLVETRRGSVAIRDGKGILERCSYIVRGDQQA